MNNIQVIKNTGLFLLAIILFYSCDKISAPYINSVNETTVSVEFPALDTSMVYRKILLEDYTGHQCGNCPAGHERLTELLGIYKDTLVAMAIHAGNFASTSNGLFATDFTTEIGNQWYSDFNIGVVPSALINRVTYGNYIFVTVNNWQNAINAVDRSKCVAAIQLIDQYSNNVLTSNAKVTILDEISDPVKLSLVLVEDDIIAPQLTATDTVIEYVHNHVLRAGINGTYGSNLTEDGLVIKDSTYTKAFLLPWENQWIKENCSIIAFLINATTNEVLQVEKIDL